MRNFKLWQSIVQEVSSAPMAFVKFVCCVYATKTFLVDVTYVLSLSLPFCHWKSGFKLLNQITEINILFVQSPGPSMLPTMNTSGSGDLVLADRLSPLLGRIGRGDIVVVRSPENPRKLITKRIIAMENDSITFLLDPQNSDKSESVVVCLLSHFALTLIPIV